ncbi:autotransporter assembly complex protein TamA [Thermomonas sp. S9]|uniref:autotransporter assembly complex protein TamA n=1 Tax=Thermomonas sp. S9 TaxID=2885203 RepID=UPI00216AF946|nr:autotransporter assembly complex family protein [Thermomonas sp. S9]MCR6495025.1 autotransporter assembly complex protein TamA [Thermomonas sp. S9]
MPIRSPRLPLLLVCLCAAAPAWAVKVDRIEIEGLKDAALRDNVRSALSLNDELGKDLRARRLGYLLREADAEARRALEPFGYYAPTIEVLRSDRPLPAATPAAEAGLDAETAETEDSANAAERQRRITVTLRITPGLPVRVRGFDVAVDGPGRSDSTVVDALQAFQPRPGQVLDHARYEASKAQVAGALAHHGYFDTQLVQHRVEVTRAAHAADIALRWDSGPRFAFGPAQFTQTPQAVVWPRLLDRLVPWTPGAPYDEAQVDRLRQSLQALDYFALVDVQADPAAASDGRVPVQVQLTPAKRSLYSAGLSYGTVSGTGVSLGIERRYLNRRGHKALAQIDWAQKRKTATVQYRIPAFAWLDGWYTASLQAADEQTAYVNSRRLELVAGRTGQYSKRLALSATLHLLRERWAYYVLTKPTPSFQFASFVFPELRGDYIDVDNRLAPRRGGGLGLTLRGGRGGNASFTQLHARAQWFHGLDADSRLIVRGELGHTFTRDVLDLPPSLRFYAGGDRSVRGYGWHELGPRILTSGGPYYTGAPNVVTASLEYERYFKGPWGAAVFVDTGNAFAGRAPGLRTGVGLGLRWRSPVGPVRIDIARGLNAPDSPLSLYLNIGPDL